MKVSGKDRTPLLKLVLHLYKQLQQPLETDHLQPGKLEVEMKQHLEEKKQLQSRNLEVEMKQHLEEEEEKNELQLQVEMQQHLKSLGEEKHRQ